MDGNIHTGLSLGFDGLRAEYLPLQLFAGMKTNPIIALGLPMAALVVSALFFLLQPGPAPRGSVSDGNSNDSALPAKDGDDNRPEENAASGEAALLLAKYAESEVQRQKELADERRPVFVPPPLVLLDPTPEMGLTQAQTAKFMELRQSFVDGLTKLGKDPTSREYLEYWTQAQSHLDDQVRLHLGEDVVLALSAQGFAALNARKIGPE